MKALKKELQTVGKSLKMLAAKTEKMAKKLEKLEKTQAVKKPKAAAKVKAKPAVKKSVRKAGDGTAMDKVLALIKRSKKGVNTAQLKAKTGYNDKKIWNAINRLKNQGKIKSERKGIYVGI